MSTTSEQMDQEIFQGQFGEFMITDRDRQGVIIYRSALMIAAICFGIGAIASISILDPVNLHWLSLLFIGFSVALGVALANIHIYLKPLHQTLQVFLGIGSLVSLVLAAIAIQNNQSLAFYIYNHPLTIFGVGFTFAALTGIYFKEAFCFNRFETKFLVAIAPTLLIGHIFGIFSIDVEKNLLISWAVLFFIFALRKLFQDIPADIGDKSVFDYLEKSREMTREKTEKSHGTTS